MIKHSTLFLAMILCTILSAQENGLVVPDTCKWLKDEAEWFYTPWSINHHEDLAKIEIMDDTLIGNRLCSVMGLYKEEEYVENSDLIVFYERKNNRVYFNENDSFKLMYDFSPRVLPGDTIEFYLPQKFLYYDITSSEGAFIPSHTPYKYRYESQEWVTLPDGEQLRIVNTSPIPISEQENGCFDLGRIIDGVGSDRGILGKSCTILPAGSSEYFRCFKSKTWEYTEVDGACNVTSTDDVVHDQQVSVFPNPASDEILIESEIDFYALKIYDLSGRYLLAMDYQSTINLGQLPNGLYILELIGNAGNYRHKIVKSH